MKKIIYTVLILVIALMLSAAVAELEISVPDVIMSGCPVQICAFFDGNPIEAEWSTSNEKYLKFKSSDSLVGYNQSESEVEAVISAVYLNLTAEKVIKVVPAATSFIINYNGENCPNTTKEIGLGEQIQFAATCKPASAAVAAVWTSSNESVAIVDENGCVKGIGTGTSEITATLPNGRYTHCTVKVFIEPEGIVLPENIELAVGSVYHVEVNEYPQGADISRLNWKSNNQKICEVNKTGKLTANGVGNAIITCTLQNGQTSDISVEVYRGVSEINPKRRGISLAVNSSAQLEFEIRPSNAKYTGLMYYSSNPEVASVDENGIVTGKSEGKCRIYAEEKDGKKAYTDVNVVYIRLEKVEFEAGFLTLKEGESCLMNPVYTPENASDKIVVYESSDKDIAFEHNGVLTAVSEGRCKLRVYVDGKQTDEMTVRVITPESLPLAGIIIGVNPGHQISMNLAQKPIRPGSSETGNANSGYAVGIVTYTKEYEVALSVGLYMRDILEGLGAEVVMTRTENDVHINNIERAEMLNAAGVDFAIQLHCDNNPNDHTVTGMAMFVKSKDYESRDIAEVVLAAACAATGAKNRNVRWYDRYMSLNYSTTPTALIEMGYLSTPEDDLLLSDDAYRLKVAQGICEGILEYYCSK